MVSFEGPEENQAVRPRNLCGYLSLGARVPWMVPEHLAFSTHILDLGAQPGRGGGGWWGALLPLTFSIFILILSQWLKLMRLALSPVAPTLQIREKMNQGSISSGMRLSFSGDIFLRPWG